MAEQSMNRIVALDGGTTNTRARLIEAGKVVATARRAVGVRDNVIGSGEPSPLLRSVRECIDEVLERWPGVVGRIVATGMLSSEVGLAGVPHVIAPAGLSDLAKASVERSIPELHPLPILVVPGIKTPPGAGPDDWTEADVMRGEEVETFGAMESLGICGSPCAFLWPGSHTKLMLVDDRGRIARSFTTLAGEITATLASQTLIAKSLPRTLPDEPDLDALRQGMRAVRRDGLGRAAFLVRIADLTGSLDEAQRAAFWIGAVIADDAALLAVHPILSGGIPLWVGGREPQRSLYASCLMDRSGDVRTIDDAIAAEASALGALAISKMRG
jgi:2-dehydro-3-deoxygalactonokinase